MHTQEITYRPQTTAKDSNVKYTVTEPLLVECSLNMFFHKANRVSSLCQMCAAVTVGFVKDAIHHIDIQGFNVYHKNRLIKVRSDLCISI